jgi:hypothetical protein
MRKRLTVAAAGISLLAVAAGAFANGFGFFSVRAGEFDPLKTHLVQGTWLDGIGCPTDARTTTDGVTEGPSYTDPACPAGDPRDKHVRGLLLAKTGPTVENFASAVAEVKGVRGKELNELGYDIRKPGPGPSDDRGSHCGAGAPRFNVETDDGGFYFLGCNSPSATKVTPLTPAGWLRLRWGGPDPLMAYDVNNGFALVSIKGKTLKSLTIVFDEGTDAAGGPDNFGLAVLDNIDVNGRLVGTGVSTGR